MMATYLSWDWRLRLAGFLAISGAFAFGGNRTLAQTIIPDATLGAEGSVVTPGVNVGGVSAERIDGGAVRGVNLFHSFQEFNVRNGGAAYFANPIGIENILSRVTGTNPSTIFGKLGVLGNANLFLINPNGIIFGAGAQLDIRGSFFASTASSFKFPDGSEFSATNPIAPPLLTVNVTPGLQWGTSLPGASITNRGNLAVGRNLTLFADKLDLQGQLEAFGDLTLLAQDTVKVRDSGTSPFLALSGGNLTVQGNGGIDILALNHPTSTPFVSGGNLSLISDGIISGDARFRSGGSFSIKSVSGGLANFVSFYDPIISSTGDVDVAANYTGTSLLVEAQGNIRFQGDINITGLDTSTLPAGPDTATLSSSSALIMRSGQSSLAYGGVNSGTVPGAGTGGVPAGITIGGDVILQPFNGSGGIVSLLAALGNVNTQAITTNGGTINIHSAESITTNRQTLDTTNGENNEGAITLSANGSISIGDLSSSSYSKFGSTGNGGNISLFAANGINITGDLSSFSYSEFGAGKTGNGGNISLITTNGSISTSGLSSFSYSQLGKAGNGGNINLSTNNGSISVGELYSYSSSQLGKAGNGGNISLFATNGSISMVVLSSWSSSEADTAGNGGNISLFATNDINIASNLYSWSSSSASTAGNGGDISLIATNGSISTDGLFSYSSSSAGTAGNGGNISLLTANASINTGILSSYSSSSAGTAGNGGNISLFTTNGSINTSYLFSVSSSHSGKGGNGGNINLIAINGINITDGLFSYSYSKFGSTGNGGNISLFATNGINIGGFLFSSSSSEADTAGNGGNISLFTSNGSISTKDLFSLSSSNSGIGGNGGSISLIAANGSITTRSLVSASGSHSGSAGQGGAISIEAVNGSIHTGSLSSWSYSNFGSGGQGGNISLLATNTIQLLRYEYDPNTDIFKPFPGGSINSTGVLGSGNISLVSHAPLALDKSVISSDTFGSGRGGDIYISAPSIALTNGAQISASTHSSGQGGNITLLASDSVELSGAVTEVPKGIFSDQTGLARIPPGTFLGGFIPTGEVPPRDDKGVPQFPAGTLFPSGVFTQTTVGSTGSAGNISIETGRVIIKDQAGLGTTTFGQDSNAGNISVQARDSISLDNGSIKSGVAGGARGNSGNITVNTNTLSTVNGGQLLTSTFGDGQAGDIIVNAKEIQLSGSNSGLFAQTNSAANAGNLTIQPLGNGQTLRVNFFGGAQISASTSGSGRGGNLTITAPESITLTGNGSIISAETSGSGTGGDLTLKTGTLTVRDGAKVTVSGTQTGNAGNMEIISNSVLLDNGGKLIAETASGKGGNIKLQVKDLLLMRRNSQISTSAGTASAGGNGGNITISAPFVVAVPSENSDIRANAYTGKGGRVDITANSIFGFQVQREDSPKSDISASSRFGVQGSVTLNTPDVDPSRGLTNLPSEVVDASNQIDQNCSATGAAASKQSSFVVTGRGGLPPNPKEPLSKDAVQVDWVTLNPRGENRSSPAVSVPKTSATPTPLVEAQGWLMNAKGQVVLTANAPTVTPHSPWHRPTDCLAPRSTPAS
jgi:filamentous hemagglutinin family protein